MSVELETTWAQTSRSGTSTIVFPAGYDKIRYSCAEPKRLGSEQA